MIGISAEWGFYCKKCKAMTSTGLNHGEKRLSLFAELVFRIKKYNFFKGIEHEFSGVCDIFDIGGSFSESVFELEKFVLEHKKNLCLISEYGDMKELTKYK